MEKKAATAQDCSATPGRVAPVVDRNRCEAKAECVSVCPYDVFEIRPLAPAERAALSLRGRLKAFVHGHRQAWVARPDDCHACQLCIAACPEQALRLAPFEAPRAG
jgi:NAD-dependent dihydropyrimidine dehydrogenase PreA subunit